MRTTTVDADTAARERSHAILGDLFASVPRKDFAVRLWDGSSWSPPAAESRPAFTLVLKHPGSLRRMFLPPNELSVGEAYIYDDFDVEGDIESLVALGKHLDHVRSDLALAARLGRRLLALPNEGGRTGSRAADLTGGRHSPGRDVRAVRYHYDVSNEFFGLWLDRHMMYSCAYFESPDEDLDVAQERKLDYICRKLRLRPGERLLDVGCGWGGLVMHAAARYGVHAEGITLSPRQAELAGERINEAGLVGRCDVALRDYRGIDQAAAYDKMASVGMFEHVGEAKLPEYFARAYQALRPGGVLLNHGIAANTLGDPLPRGGFTDRYVFPDGELVPIGRTLQAAEEAGFEVRDVESLREHYALTLREWGRRLESRAEEARAAADDVTYRVWRLFMSASALGFASGSLNLYQTLLVKPEKGRSGLPLTRRDWYA